MILNTTDVESGRNHLLLVKCDSIEALMSNDNGMCVCAYTLRNKGLGRNQVNMNLREIEQHEFPTIKKYFDLVLESYEKP